MKPTRLLALAAAWAALPLAAGTGAESAPAAAHVRFWKTDLPGTKQVRVVFKTGTGKHPAAHDLGTAGPGYQFNNYVDAPAGHGTLEIYADADKIPLLSQPADFAAGAFVSVILSQPEKAGSLPRIEVVEDNGGAAGSPRAQITVRSFLRNVKEMRVTVGESLNAQFVAGDSFLRMRGLKAAVYMIRTVGTGQDDKPFEWNNETDLRLRSHQTLLIYPDPYGRVRPRLIVDGENAPDAPDNRDGQH